MLYARLDQQKRRDFIERLQPLGFTLILGQEEIVTSPFPFAVSLEEKTIACLTTASYSALALSNGAILSDEDFEEKINQYIQGEKNGW